MEEEALARFCRLMISRLRHKRQQEQQQPDEATGEKTTAVGRGRGRVRTEAEGDTDRKLRPAHSTRQGGLKPSTDLLCRGLEVQAVPLQLISTLRLRRLREEMERAADVELHDPAVCRVCEQEQASVALRTFIWRKKTQLQMKTAEFRLNTQPSHKVRDFNRSPRFPPSHTR